MTNKAPAALSTLRDVLSAIPFEIVNPAATEVREAATYTAAKDAPSWLQPGRPGPTTW